MNIESKVGLHNEFLIEVIDKNTGEIKQTGKAYNIILDAMYTRLVNFQSYFVNIHFGTGTGTKDATRTSLFTHLGTKTATDVELKKDVANNSIYWKRLIQLMPEEYVGNNITEVGIAYGSTSTNLVTHAQIQDSQGNPIAITKTDLDLINIYATVYIVLSNNYSNVAWTTTNELINYLVGNTTFPTMYFHLGKIGTYDPAPKNPLVCQLKLGSSAAIAQADWIKDATNKKITTPAPPAKRIDINTGNGSVREIGFGSTDSSGIFRVTLPVTGVYTSDQTTNEPLGTGDGSKTTWTLANPDAQYIELKVDSTVVTGTSSNINLPPNVKLRNPSTLPTGVGQNCSWSSDGTYLVVTYTASPCLTIYKKSIDSFNKLANPDYLPTSVAYGCAFSNDNNYLAVGNFVPPYIIIYKRNGDVFSKLNDPDVLPSDTANGCSWSPDGTYLAISHSNSPFITIYKRSGDSFTKLANPTNLPTGVGRGCSWSSDGTYLVVAHDTSPYVTIYKRSGDTFTKLSNPDILPAGNGNGCSFSADTNYLAIAHATSPYVTIYKRNGDSFSKLSNPDVLPLYNCNSCSFSNDGIYLMTTFGNQSPFISYYKRTGDIFTKILNPDVLPNGAGVSVNGSNFSNDGNYLAIVSNGSPYIQIYKRTGQQTSVTFDTPPAVGTIPKASYTVEYIPKDTNRVIDLQFSIQFGEVV